MYNTITLLIKAALYWQILIAVVHKKNLFNGICFFCGSLILTPVVLANVPSQCLNPDIVLTKKNPDFSLNSTDLNTSYNVCDGSGNCQAVPFGNDGINSLIIAGSNGVNIIHGTRGPDIICGGSGNDEIDGGEGDDVIYGNNGKDTLSGGLGNDDIYGGNGQDTIYGYDEDAIDDPILSENMDDDDLYGEKGRDVLRGGPGNDTLDGGNGKDDLYGSEGNDTLSGGKGNDYLDGENGNDVIYGGRGNDKCVDSSNTDGTNDCISYPAGIYSIDTIVDKSFIDGVLIRIYWSEIEKAEGNYDFSKLARVIRKAESLGQSVSVAVMTMAEPAWLLNKTETFFHPQFGLTTVPWDSTLLSALEKLANAISAYQIDGIELKSHPAVKQIDASIGGIQSIRLTQLPPGYNAATFINAVYASVGYWANAFPNKFIYVGLFGVSDGASNPTTAEILRDGLLARFNGVGMPRINFFQELLTGNAPTLKSDLANIVANVKNETSILFQACGEWKNQPAWPWCHWPINDSPSAGLSHGYNHFNTTYFEFYQADLLNDANTSQFQQWHDTLQQYFP